MDQSQIAAEPLKSVSPTQFIKEFVNPETQPDPNSPEAVENRARAAQEISMIFELKDLVSFKWFIAEFIDKPYRAAFDALRDPRLRQDNETLENIQQRYVALRAVRVGMLEREIAHREQITPNDSFLHALREQLNRF